MDARIAVGNEIISLSQLKQTGQDPEAGRVVGAAARRAGARKDHARRHDDPVPVRHAAAAAAAAAAAGVGARFGALGRRLVLHDGRRACRSCCTSIFVIYLRNVDWPRKPDIEAVPDRFVQMVVKKEEKKPEPKKEEVAKTDEEKKDEKKKGDEEKKPAKRELTDEEKAKLAEAKAKADAERRARLAEQVKSTGLLKLLGAKSDAGGSIADVLGKGDVDRDQEKAFQGVGGVGVASGNDSLRGIKSGGSGSGRVADAGSLRGGAGIAGGEHRQGRGRADRQGRHQDRDARRRRRAGSRTWSPRRSVRRLGAIKACYERALKRNPNLSRQGRHPLDDHPGRHRVGRGRRAGHAGRRRGRELHQVADRALAFPGAGRRLGRRFVPVRVPGLAVIGSRSPATESS